MSFFHFRRNSNGNQRLPRRQAPCRFCRPRVEWLEDRTTPTVLDLTMSNTASGMINGAIFTNVNTSNFNGSAGNGNLNPDDIRRHAERPLRLFLYADSEDALRGM